MTRDLGRGTNTVAEWQALLWALEVAKAAGLDELEVAGDSEVVVRQANGAYAVRAANLVPYKAEFDRISAEFSLLRVVWVPRETNHAGWMLE